MVLLIATPAAKAAVDEYLRLCVGCDEKNEALQQKLDRLEKTELDGPVEHSDLIDISKWLLKEQDGSNEPAKRWRLDTLLKGTTVYQPPPPPKPEPVSRPVIRLSLRILTSKPVGPIQSFDATATPARRATRIRTHDQPSS